MRQYSQTLEEGSHLGHDLRGDSRSFKSTDQLSLIGCNVESITYTSGAGHHPGGVLRRDYYSLYDRPQGKESPLDLNSNFIVRRIARNGAPQVANRLLPLERLGDRPAGTVRDSP